MLQELAANAACPPHLLEQMSRSPSRGLRRSVAGDPRSSPQALKRIAARSAPSQGYVLVPVAANPNCDAELFDEMASHSNSLIREAVAANPNCPRHLLERLAQDSDRGVCDEAAATIRARLSSPPGG